MMGTRVLRASEKDRRMETSLRVTEICRGETKVVKTRVEHCATARGSKPGLRRDNGSIYCVRELVRQIKCANKAIGRLGEGQTEKRVDVAGYPTPANISGARTSAVPVHKINNKK